MFSLDVMDSWGQLSVEVTTNIFSTLDARPDQHANRTVFLVFLQNPFL